MTQAWMLGLVLNAVIGTAFITVGVILAWRLTATRDWGANPLAAAFTLVALTCGWGHLTRGLLLAGPSLGIFQVAGAATRVEFADWHMWVADTLTAIAGVFYLVVRFRNPELLWTTKVFDDLRERRTRALVVHDRVVQDLAEAKFALEREDAARSRRALRRALDASMEVISGGVQGPPSLEPVRSPGATLGGDEP